MKAPNIDGMTMEVLLAYSSFLQKDCLDMIHQFWETDSLARQTTADVLKLVPKKADKRQLKDWQTITMFHPGPPYTREYLVGLDDT